MNLVLFDNPRIRRQLLPLTFTRPIAALRAGISTLKERSEHFLNQKASWLTDDYLHEKFPLKESEEYLMVNGSVVMDQRLAEAILDLKPREVLKRGKKTIALRSKELDTQKFNCQVDYEGDVLFIEHPWDLFSNNKELISSDFTRITAGRNSQPLSQTNIITGQGDIFVEPGAVVEGAFLNASNGPIYIGAQAEVMEGAKIRGPFAMGEHAVLKMDAKIYGATTLGPHVKVGGEINNSIFLGYSNKAHDGFLGQAVIGEWCNLGADTNNSNLKNTYDNVRMWCYHKREFVNTGLQFCGLVMGDHSKCGINTMFNTGTMIGVNVNIFGPGFPRNFVPSFRWGGAQGFKNYSLSKAYQVAETVMERRGIKLDQAEKSILEHVYSMEKELE